MCIVTVTTKTSTTHVVIFADTRTQVITTDNTPITTTIIINITVITAAVRDDDRRPGTPGFLPSPRRSRRPWDIGPFFCIECIYVYAYVYVCRCDMCVFLQISA